ncbi:GINS complex [Kalmanozyma brasiliensis GHG001]|uniref:DNA replication complex GINS protein PSF2 n=1 Tax=Kalmanozyma brasiliensis (strain GHG001) TaxID=1365824 RepID=V5E7H3_KALBG|nr:GINS complex [Kalmanozyma brasiliensis GHG001]EST06241.1 GINS complex [Kalmanozyma brasiliensis GHG001]
MASVASSSIGSIASTSLSTSSYTRGNTLTDLELASTTLESLTIVPLTSIDRVRLLSGIYGPFRPPTPVSVPLWVALHLKKRKKAILVPPTWLTVDALTESLKHETTQPGFAPLPHHWIGVSQALLSGAADDIPNSSRVRSLLKDIREARQSKILSGVAMVNSVHLQMHNISAHEVAELRGFFGTAFSHLKALRAPSEVEAEGKRQSELGARNRWMLMPDLPDRLDGWSAGERSRSGGGEDESMRTDGTDESRYAGPGVRAQPRQSNVSDSGYHSGPLGRSKSPADLPQERQPQRAPQYDANRPPRFAVDEDEDEDS